MITFFTNAPPIYLIWLLHCQVVALQHALLFPAIYMYLVAPKIIPMYPKYISSRIHSIFKLLSGLFHQKIDTNLENSVGIDDLVKYLRSGLARERPVYLKLFWWDVKFCQVARRKQVWETHWTTTWKKSWSQRSWNGFRLNLETWTTEVGQARRTLKRASNLSWHVTAGMPLVAVLRTSLEDAAYKIFLWGKGGYLKVITGGERHVASSLRPWSISLYYS